MKKYYVEFKFTFKPLLKGAEGGDYIPSEFDTRRMVRTVNSKIDLDSLPKTQDLIVLLDDANIGTIFGEYADMFETLEDVRNTFTFEAERRRGWIEKTPVGKVFHRHMFWVNLIYDQGNKRVRDADAESDFIISQLVRFGIIDKLRK
ncbi:MAG TPA: hypothetical protein VEC13_00130 [Candidatus Paceibacterota bacterium]|nr:hypothetical protein [Candidatus Paceibacterota bacterium]